MQQLRREVSVDLAAQTADLDIDDIGLRVKVIIPDRLEEHGPGDHLSLVPHKLFEQPELARLESNRLAGTLRPPRPQIQP